MHEIAQFHRAPHSSAATSGIDQLKLDTRGAVGTRNHTKHFPIRIKKGLKYENFRRLRLSGRGAWPE